MDSTAPVEQSRRELLFANSALLGALGFACHPASGSEAMLVGAASSLRGLLEAARPRFPLGPSPVNLEFSFDASSTLARQIEAGAPFDLFLSADLASCRRVSDWAVGEPRVFLGNRLALVARSGLDRPARKPSELPALQGPIAIGAPEVPAGRYTRAFLEAHGLHPESIPFAGRFVHGRNARAVLGLVESGAADHGFVYHSDAESARRARHVWSATADQEPKVAYHLLVANDAPPSAHALADWLVAGGLAPEARRLGFTPHVG